jgi:hypothetical protein
MKKILLKLQGYWKLSSLLQVLIVLIVFACTGSTVLFIKKPLFALLGIDSSLSGWKGTFLYLIIVFPLYQVLLLLYGFVFGQFRFFWEFEKKTWNRFATLFRRKRSSTELPDGKE